MECEVSSQFAKAQIPDRGAQHHQDRRERSGRGEFNAVRIFTIWQKESRNLLWPGGLGRRYPRHDDAKLYGCNHPVRSLERR